MSRYIVRRFLSLVPTMFVIVTLSFFLVRFAPGGPFSSERKVPEQVLQNLLKKYHMDESLPRQYLRYLGDILRGDFGPSFRYRDSTVNQLISQSFPNSMMLGSLALTMAVTAGIAVGVISALKQNRWQDYTAMSVAVIGISVPLFVIGPVLQLVFGMRLRWFPISGWITSREGLRTLVLPALTLSFPYFAYIARLSRASILEVLRSDYVRTARAKGLQEGVVIARHVLKGGLLPVVSYLGPLGDHHRIPRRRIGLRHTGRRSDIRAVRDQSRLHAHHGRGDRLFADPHLHEFPRRHRLRFPRSAHRLHVTRRRQCPETPALRSTNSISR